jgi:hypothetical protein
LMVRRGLRIWIHNQSLDFFLGQTVDACDLPEPNWYSVISFKEGHSPLNEGENVVINQP